jgi:hypothetical protein
MFHLFKRAYLEFDYKFDSIGYKMLMATDLYNLFPMPTDICILPSVGTFDELLANNFENDVEQFWQYMYEADHKLIAYLKTDVTERLLIQYAKSIFQYASEQDVYLLYKSMVESVRVRSYIQVNAPDTRHQMVRDTFKMKSFEEFKVIYDAQPVSNFLRNVINKQDVSFEYLLPDYLYHGEESLCKEEILDRVRIISIDNWRDELEQLRLETMFGFLDMGVIDPDSNFEIGNVEDQLKNSSTLNWMVDENFSAEPSYITSNYDYNNLVNQWHSLERIWVPDHTGNEDMFEVNQMLMAEDWEGLLHRDINRNFGCLYTFELFREKSNQIFSTYCYRKKRQNLTADLAPFRLY